MPAPVTIPSSARTVSKPANSKPRGSAHAKKTRLVRRRGRARGASESDDELERDVGTDSDSEDGSSSVDSSSDSDTEPASEDIATNGDSRILTPSTSQSLVNGISLAKTSVAQVNGHDTSFFATSGNWSEMVAEENDNGPADLPVIDFAELGSATIPSRTARPRKVSTVAGKTLPTSEATSLPSPPLSVKEDHEDELEAPAEPETAPSSEPIPERRPPNQSARQAYQKRLEDPSYVPTVGEFWGHDDRLLDKNLRSLSGWWRGRWQGRGRGRGGFDRGLPMRGRGGFARPPSVSHQEAGGEAPKGEVEETKPAGPSIDRAWTHDGFEEMKKTEDRRRALQLQQQQQQSQQAARGFGGFRGRGGFVAGRGRGSFVRGGFNPSPARSGARSPFLAPGRVWFVMKPELMWTKQHDGFLHFDPALKPRHGQGPGLRVKLPGNSEQIIRAPPRHRPQTPAAKPDITSTSSVPGSDYGDKVYVVRLPKRAGKEKATEVAPEVAAQPAVIDESPIEDVFTVRPRLVAVNPIPLPEPSNVRSIPVAASVTHYPDPQSNVPQALPEVAVQQQLEQLSMAPPKPDPARWAQTEEAVLRNPPANDPEPLEVPSSSTSDRPDLPPLQTSFTPEPQGSPAFGSPYAYPPPLPPGVAIDHLGMPYEFATGRPVYLQPPVPMFNPRPVMHHMAPPGIPFVPGHMHHRSVISPDYLPQPPPHTPPVNGFLDPATGTPIFSFPRQSSRIEIRAPTEKSTKGTHTRQPSMLRTSAATFEPSRPSENGPHYFPAVTEEQVLSSYPSAAEGADENPTPADATHHAGQSVEPPMVAYNPYQQQQQQYYYPETYGYPQYMDMSQAGQYEMYPPEMQQVPIGTVYY